MAHIAILGSGGFGCSLAVMCAGCGHTVTLWSPFKPEVEQLRTDREHTRLLPGIKLPEQIEITDDISGAAAADFVIVATPSFAVRSACRTLAQHIRKGVPVSCVAKGFEPETNKLLADVMAEELPHNPVVILSGPSHAEEVGRGVPTSIVAASTDRSAAEFTQELLMNETLRIYINDDVVGVELGAALKNVIALAAGVCDGLGLGDNSKAALMTRGITEIARLGTAMGAHTETFAGLSGIGDLIVTCTSMHSRNRRAGILVGQGKTAQQAIEEVGMTVEGYTAAACAYRLSKTYGVEMPVTREIYKVMYEGKNVKEAARDLMVRPGRHESEKIWLNS